jgi:DNA-binding transcriptional LysR family regulator
MRYPYMRRLEMGMVYHAVLLEECHVTKAAKRCFVSQPAISRSLERLREALGDDLLLRSGREYKRTPRGERLLRDLQTLLPKLEGVLQGERFNPADCQDRFQIAMTDHACLIMLPELVRRISAAAPLSSIEVWPWHERCFEDVLSGRWVPSLRLPVSGHTLRSKAKQSSPTNSCVLYRRAIR